MADIERVIGVKSRNQDMLDFLKNILGEDKFQEVASALAGERITFPRSIQWLDKNKRNKAILYDYYGGAEINELATKYELSESHIYKIVEKRC